MQTRVGDNEIKRIAGQRKSFQFRLRRHETTLTERQSCQAVGSGVHVERKYLVLICEQAAHPAAAGADIQNAQVAAAVIFLQPILQKTK